ncbi:hypothetical protein PR048_019506 [Dryococelus australis]|uniref:Uncharacterized protein n=1 Tax=Dryococelus australis TaxID=614101 RepID=A0ABQ9H404_9NEOP|nr:hypothetical protein PR048_019506 [Dryococelus australis]
MGNDEQIRVAEWYNAPVAAMRTRDERVTKRASLEGCNFIRSSVKFAKVLTDRRVELMAISDWLFVTIATCIALHEKKIGPALSHHFVEDVPCTRTCARNSRARSASRAGLALILHRVKPVCTWRRGGRTSSARRPPTPGPASVCVHSLLTCTAAFANNLPSVALHASWCDGQCLGASPPVLHPRELKSRWSSPFLRLMQTKLNRRKAMKPVVPEPRDCIVPVSHVFHSDSDCVGSVPSKCNIPRRRLRQYFEQLDAFERSRIVGLREAGWSFRCYYGYGVRHELATVTCSECLDHHDCGYSVINDAHPATLCECQYCWQTTARHRTTVHTRRPLRLALNTTQRRNRLQLCNHGAMQNGSNAGSANMILLVYMSHAQTAWCHEVRFPVRSHEILQPVVLSFVDAHAMATVYGEPHRQTPSPLENMQDGVLPLHTYRIICRNWTSATPLRGRGGVVVRLLGSHLGQPGSIPCGAAPGFSHVRIVPVDASDRQVFSGFSPFPRLFILALLHTHLETPSLALKIWMLRAAHISSFTTTAYRDVWRNVVAHVATRRGTERRVCGAVLRADEGEARYGAAPECKGGGIPVKTHQHHGPARFPHANIREGGPAENRTQFALVGGK